MKSLNDLIQVISKPSRIKKGIIVEFDFDPAMPQIYPCGDGEKVNLIDYIIDSPLFQAFTQLKLEMEDAKAHKILISTKYRNGYQVIEFMHNGNFLQENNLNFLNNFLEDIADGKIEWKYWRHGNLIAGQMMKEWDSRIRLENINEGEYKVRTTIEIPVKDSYPTKRTSQFS